MRRRLILLVALLVAPAAPRVTHAAWPVTGYPLCNVPEDLNAPIGRSSHFSYLLGPCVPEDCVLVNGNRLTVYWQDARSEYGSIYTANVSDVPPPDPQPVEPGTLFILRSGQQVPGGLARVYTKGEPSDNPLAATVFVWTDAPAGAPSVVRVRRDGGIQIPDWGPDGVIVAASDGSQHDPSVIHDLHGGAIVAWLDETAEHRLVYAQRLDSLGNRMWGPSGVLVGSDTTVQTRPIIAPDGVGGVFVLRGDHRGGAYTLALFRVIYDGTLYPGWPETGLVIGTAPEATPEPILRTANLEMAWVVWHEHVTLSDGLPALQPLVTLVEGAAFPYGFAPPFTGAGTPIATGLEGDAVADDAGTAINSNLLVTYEYAPRLPEPSPTSTDLFAVRLEMDGSRPAGWPATGRVVCNAPGVQRQGRMFRLGDGAFLAWTDERSGDGDIYAQELREDGSLPSEWPVNGLLVCGVAGTQQDPVIGPNTGGGFVVWRDGRDAITNGWDLYGQTVSADARLDVPPRAPIALALLPPRPNPARATVKFTLELPTSGRVRVDVLDIAGRRVRAMEFAADRGTRDLAWNLASDAGSRVSPGLYIVRVRAAGEERTARVFVAR